MILFAESTPVPRLNRRVSDMTTPRRMTDLAKTPRPGAQTYLMSASEQKLSEVVGSSEHRLSRLARFSQISGMPRSARQPYEAFEK